MSVEIYWDDLTPEKQQEILETFGDNCNYDVFPIVELSVEPEMNEPLLQMYFPAVCACVALCAAFATQVASVPA